jgi:hypothetical protein
VGRLEAGRLGRLEAREGKGVPRAYELPAEAALLEPLFTSAMLALRARSTI